MIMNGECGQFQPMLLECLLDIEDELLDISLASDEMMGMPKTWQTQKLFRNWDNMMI